MEHIATLFRSRSGAALVVALTSVVLMLVANSPAEAYSRKWNSKPLPLTVIGDHAKVKGAGYGTWWVGPTSGGTKSQANGHLIDLDPKNHKKVYFEMFTQTDAGYCIQPNYTSCNASWYPWKSQFSNFKKETWDKPAWSPAFYAATDVNPSGRYARGKMQVSESNRGPDTHSGFTFTKGYPY